jgi:hypothetical protein
MAEKHACACGRWRQMADGHSYKKGMVDDRFLRVHPAYIQRAMERGMGRCFR